MRLAPALVVAACVALPGCAAVVRRATVPVDEYAEYRRFHVAAGVEERLAAAYDYLRSNPRGAYRPEVARWFRPAERAYVSRGWESIEALEAFLRAVPAGPQAERAAGRLVELELTRDYRAKDQRAFDSRVATLERKLAAAEAGRRVLLMGVGAWVRRLAAIRTWGVRTHELDHELIYAYRLAEPAARCDDQGCAKTVTVDYSIPEGKAQSERQAVYDVTLRLESGGVEGAAITGPELFTRLGEAAQVAAVDPSDLLARAEAIGMATQVIALAVEPVLPASRCAAEAVSPVVLRRVCDGVELRVVSALELSEEDRIVVEPTRRAAAPSVTPGPAAPGAAAAP